MSARLTGAILRMSMPALEHLADGLWADLCRDEVADLGFLGWVKLSFSAGAALNAGFVEQRDDTWMRLTDAGRQALAHPDEGGVDA